MGLYTQLRSIGSFPLLIILVETSLSRITGNYQSTITGYINYMSLYERYRLRMSPSQYVPVMCLAYITITQNFHVAFVSVNHARIDVPKNFREIKS